MLERTLDGYRDSDTVSEAARDLARQLAERSYGVVVVEPGDQTRYEVKASVFAVFGYPQAHSNINHFT